ncbi:MAG: hypothetical protein PVF82_14150 [Gammaproteobacteria bacterium]|jgi:citrate synthase
MTDTRFWDNRRGTIHTRKGGMIFGSGVFSHGYSLLDELVGKTSFFQVLVLNVSGRLPERRLADWLEAVFICVSWPDPRIWCNQIGSLGGTSRASAVASTTAGILAADSTMYGSLPLLNGASFIKNALIKKQAGCTTEQIIELEKKRHKGKPKITGFARPLATGDERVVAMESVTKDLGFCVGEHLGLTYEIQEILFKQYNETMNINGYASAFLLDQGFSVDEIYQIGAVCVESGVLACFVESNNLPPESFLPMRCDDIEYTGVATRSLPPDYRAKNGNTGEA